MVGLRILTLNIKEYKNMINQKQDIVEVLEDLEKIKSKAKDKLVFRSKHIKVIDDLKNEAFDLNIEYNIIHRIMRLSDLN